jgi:hypothetical protein
MPHVDTGTAVTLRNRMIMPAATLVLALASIAPAASADPRTAAAMAPSQPLGGGGSGGPVAERAIAGGAGYWTRARMSAAHWLGAVRTPHRHRKPGTHTTDGAHGTDGAHAAAGGRAAAGTVNGVAWAGGGAVARTTGRVFFTLDGTDYACSGSVVDGASTDVVVTAGHCVSDGTGGWAQNWTFIPGYAQGKAPLGAYPARMFVVAGPWADGADEDDDVAFVAVGPARVGGALRHVADVAGGQPIAFGSPSRRADVFGYPAVPPFTGARLDYCAGPVVPDPYGAADDGIACAMTEGDSGGPWLSGFDPRTGLGTITGVSSFKYSGAGRTLYSPDLGPVAQALYTRAESGD